MCGLATWAYQMYYGFGVTGDNWPVYWAFHETNFVFWIGISHAGTLISAILRMVNATWRRPVTRCAEVITAFALMIGAMFPLIHLGRPWLAWWLIPYPSERGIWPNYRSPLVWDFFAINTYLLSSLLFLALPDDSGLRADSGSGDGLAQEDLRLSEPGMAGNAETVAPAGIGDAHHGAGDHSDCRVRAHDRVVRFFDGGRADVAFDDLRSLLCGAAPYSAALLH